MNEQVPQPQSNVARAYHYLENFTASAELTRYSQRGPVIDVREVALDDRQIAQARWILGAFGIVPPDTMLVAWQSEFPHQHNTYIESGSESVFLHLDYGAALTRIYTVTRQVDGGYVTHKSDHYADPVHEQYLETEQLPPGGQVTPIELAAVVAIAEVISYKHPDELPPT
ncbi:MAG TPA: hypothetical protein VN031_02965 [Candidatus Microsaccharimonas sp.]|nr:hypothetical protein [Candidatus Microsaccharimonas sp.]